MLPVTATLLGLVYAGLAYWLQTGFSKLRFTRHILEDLVKDYGKILLDLLVGASIVSLFAIIGSIKLVSITFWIFAVVFSVDLLKATANQGYVITIFSSKFIPANYGRFRQFLRKIINAGPTKWLNPLFILVVVLFYPIFLCFKSNISWILTEKSVIVFIFSSTAISLLQIRTFLIEAFDVLKEMENKQDDPVKDDNTKTEEKNSNWDDKKKQIEQKIISERLSSIGVLPWYQIETFASKSSWTSRDLHDKPVLKSPPWVKESGSCHFNIIIPYLDSDSLTRTYIFRWSRNILATVADSKTEVRQYSLSFFRKELEKCNHFGMIRASRDDIIKTLSQNLSDEEFIMNLPGRYLSPAVAEF